VVGWTDPEGSRPRFDALLLAYYDPDDRLVYSGRAGTGIGHAKLERLWSHLQPLATPKMPLDVPPPRDSRFGSPLTLSRVHWVRPELVAEVKYLTWTEDNLLRQVAYEGLREDKPAADVRRAVPYPKPAEPVHPATRAKQRERPIRFRARGEKSIQNASNTPAKGIPRAEIRSRLRSGYATSTRRAKLDNGATRTQRAPTHRTSIRPRRRTGCRASC
jgi:hypothetical protein